ncbi:hypothetical protein [Microbacterium sp. Root180]|uniref:hypothetical protein n=1 Tax=Microbacterium sp. Root180 TaxID=1736483 RepID=UPI0012FA4A9C|nr:hypothetical protein [Microbacterium sp. Root180]
MVGTGHRLIASRIIEEYRRTLAFGGANGGQMVRRRELRGVADALAAMFCSRNSDYQGAWLPGVLCHRMLTAGRRSITIDLLDASSDEIESVVGVRARDHIARHCERIGLAPATVRSAVIRVNLEEREPSRSRSDGPVAVTPLDRATWWFTATVTIVDDSNRPHTSAHRGWCWPDSRKLPIDGRSIWGPLGEIVRV